MATTINSYSVGLTLDASQYIDNSKLSRSETRALVKAINSARDPVENFSREQEVLNKALEQGGIQQEIYDRLLDKAEDKWGINAEAKREAAEAQDRINKLTREGESITRSLMTEEEKHAIKLRELKELYDTQSIGLTTYERALQKAETELRQNSEEHKEHQRLLKRGEELTKQYISPLQKFAAEHRELRAVLRAGTLDQETYNKALADSKKRFKQAQDSIDGKTSSFDRLSKGATVAAGAIASVTAAVYAVIQIKNSFDDIAEKIDGTTKSAQKLGMTYTEFNSLGFAAGEAGVEIDSLEKAMQNMVKKGFAGSDIRKSLLEQLDTISDMGTQTERMTKAYEVFGKTGPDVLVFLQNGRDALEESLIFADKWTSLTEEQVVGVEQYNDTWARVETIVSGISDKFVAEFAPAMTLVAESLIEYADTWHDSLSSINKVVDWTVYLHGQYQDLAELSGLFFTNMRNAVKLDFSGFFSDMSEAFTFDKADKNIAALQKKREELEIAGAERFKSLEEAKAKKIAEKEEELSKKEKARLEREKKEKLKAAEDAKKDALRVEEQKQREIRTMFEKSLESAKKKVEDEKKRIDEMRAQISKGPESFEVGTASAAQYTAGLTNAALASTVLTDAIAPGEQALLDEAAKQFEQMVELNKKQAEQVTKLSELVTVTKENGFKRIR